MIEHQGPGVLHNLVQAGAIDRYVLRRAINGKRVRDIGRPLPIVIVPLTLKPMMSLPVPTAQSPPVVSVVGLLALLIALRRLHRPLPEVLVSLRVLTVILG